MSRTRPTTLKGADALAKPKKDQPTVAAAVAEGRAVALPETSVMAMAQASLASGFPIPPQAAAVLGEETCDRLKAEAEAARSRPAPAADEPETPATDAAENPEA